MHSTPKFCVFGFLATIWLVTSACAPVSPKSTFESEGQVSERTKSPIPAFVPTAPTPESIRKMSPEEAKAALLARAVIEQDSQFQTFGVERRYKVISSADGWEVKIYTVLHRNGEENLGPGVPVIRIDNEWNVVSVARSY